MNDSPLGIVVALLIVAVLILILAQIYSDGYQSGMDNMANTWCMSLEHDYGEYDEKSEEVICGRSHVILQEHGP